MQRIDENTFIDDTLITCAEYQLFIDYMLEQGKYYQPDHWILHQFPAGQAREPILGVRYSDCLAFCEWLTQRESGEWILRLATKEEAKKYPIKLLKGDHIGYWLDSEYQFTWIDNSPKDTHSFTSIHSKGRMDARNHIQELNTPLALDLPLDFPLDLVQTRVWINELGRLFNEANSSLLHRDFKSNTVFKHNIILDLKFDSTLDKVISPLLNPTRAIARDLNLAFALDLDRILAVKLDTDPTLARVQELYDFHGLDQEWSKDLDRILSRDLYRIHNLALTRNLISDLNHELSITIARVSASNLERILLFSRDLSRTLNQAYYIRDVYEVSLDIYIDINVLQARIAGRSPASEGIRVVKERK